MIIEPGQEERVVEVEMSDVMRAQVLELCRRAHEKGLLEGAAQAYREGYVKGVEDGAAFALGMVPKENAEVPV